MRIFDELFAYEERTGVNPQLRTSRFVRSKNWYVNKHFMREIYTHLMLCPNSRKYKIHGLSRDTAFGLLKNYVINKKERELLQSTADVILTKRSGTTLRAFYTTNHWPWNTLKIVLDSDRQSIEALKHEVAVREQLTSLKTINIPKVLCTDLRGDAFFLSEEMILGRRFNALVDRTLFQKKLLPQLRDTYLAYGVRYAPIQTYLPPDMSEKVIALVGERAGGKRFVEALKNVIERNGLAAVSLCHGGLRPGHLAVTNGEVFFLDWKRANEGLIIFDLLKSAFIYRRLTSMIDDISEIMTSNFVGNGYRFKDLLTVGIARMILHNLPPSRIPKLLRVWKRHALSRPG